MRIVVFDTETTGLPKHRRAKLSVQPKIIEFGAIVFNERGEELEAYNQLINPHEEIEPIITKITGITQEDLNDKPSFEAVLPDIRRLFDGADLRIAHNLPFDDTLLDLELQRLEVTDFPWTPHGMCTVKENTPRYGYRPKLTQLYEDVIGEELEQTHRAIDDCRALAQIILEENYIEKFAAAIKGA